MSHAKNIIDMCSEVCSSYLDRTCIKFQFRDLASFIHPNANGSTNKHIERFRSTELSFNEFAELREYVKSKGMLAACTPFDESSVKHIEKIGFDYVKIASCSARDWHLLECISDLDIPVIASTGGLELEDVDNIVSFFRHRFCNLHVMHCVSIYPTPANECNLEIINEYVKRYEGIPIGWSTHENPNEQLPAAIAIAMGAELLERHVGLNTEKYQLNLYSSDRQQLSDWISTIEMAEQLVGSNSRVVSNEERSSLMSLERGIFCKKIIKSGEIITLEDIYFSFPRHPDGLSSGKWKEGIIASDSIKKNEALTINNVILPLPDKNHVIKQTIHEVKALLAYAGIRLSSEFAVEYSHHYGIEKFKEFGAVIIDCINREYCKKLIVLISGQSHPIHCHKLKEETFQLLHGDIEITLDGEKRSLNVGQTLLVLPGVWHSFSSEGGCVLEEISTTHYNNDSVYKDKKIQNLKLKERKTRSDHWGRYQI